MRSILSGTLTVKIDPDRNMNREVSRAVHLTLDINFTRSQVTLVSGWPTILFDDSAPLSPTTNSLRVSLSSSQLGSVDQAGHVVLPIVLHLDYSPDPFLGRRDQDVSLALTNSNDRIWERAPMMNRLSASVKYTTQEFFLNTSVERTIEVSFQGTVNPPPAPYPEAETVWFDGVLPDGASPRVDNESPFDFSAVATSSTASFLWLPLPPGCPPPPSPGQSNQLQVHLSSPKQDGTTQHFFEGATQTLSVAQGERLFAYVYIFAANWANLDEIMLQWNDGTWEHRAFWGADIVPYGVTGTVSRRRIGDLPPANVWTRLEVPASDVGLEGRTLNGMAFTVNGSGFAVGRAGRFDCYWSRAGKLSPSRLIVSVTPYPVALRQRQQITVWAEDADTRMPVRNAVVRIHNFSSDGRSATNVQRQANAPFTTTFYPQRFRAGEGWEEGEIPSGKVSAPGYLEADVDFGF